MSSPKFVVTLWDIASSNRGRNTVKAVITDARDIGVSSYANQGGEMFFTLPYNHPQIAECQPWLRHYEVKRFNPNTSVYDVVGVGLLDDYEATPGETIVYGRDYLSLIDLSITGSNNSIANTEIATIMSPQLTATIGGGFLTDTVKPPLRHITMGTIESTGQTATVLTSYQPRLQFLQQLMDIWQADSSVRPILSITRTTPFTISFQKNAGVDRTTPRLEYGGLINDFRYSPDFANFSTRLYAIGQKREGASVLFSEAFGISGSDLTAYGSLLSSSVFLDVVDQAALDRKTARAAKNAATVGRKLALTLRTNQIGPWEWGELADSLTVSISRGIVNLSGLYTVWGQEWIGKSDGSEDLFLSVLPKET